MAKKVKSDPPVALVSDLDALPAKQRLFVLEYLANGFNATKAAIAAGYSARTADSQGSRLLKVPKIAAAIKARTSLALAKREMSAERVLDGLTQVALFDPRKMYNAFGSLKPVTELGDDEAMSLAGFTVTERVTADGETIRKTTVKFADRLRAHELLGRHYKVFKDGPAGTVEDPFVVSIKSILGGEKQ